MIYSKPNDTFEAVLEGAASGLTGTLRVSIINAINDQTLFGPTAAGIAELVVSGRPVGVYTVSLTAPATPGDDYLIVWDDQTNPASTEQLTVTYSPPTPVQGDQNYLPTVTQVASHIAMRTHDKYGVMQKTFNSQTTPNDTDVQAIIYEAATKVADIVGDQVPEATIDDAQDLVATQAAMMIELSYFGSQVGTERSPYDRLAAKYELEMPRLLKAVQTADEDGTIGAETGNRTSYGFPDPDPRIGMDKVW